MHSVAPSKPLRRLLSLAILLIFCAGSLRPSPWTRTARLQPPATPRLSTPSVQDLKNGHANDAIALLQQDLAKNSANAADHDLLCRVYIQEEQWARGGTGMQSCCRAGAEQQPLSSMARSSLRRRGRTRIAYQRLLAGKKSACGV